MFTQRSQKLKELNDEKLKTNQRQEELQHQVVTFDKTYEEDEYHSRNCALDQNMKHKLYNEQNVIRKIKQAYSSRVSPRASLDI